MVRKGVDMSKRASHSWQADLALERPEGALPLARLVEHCTSCGDCVEVCPVYALLLDGAGLPYYVDKAACTECGLCADVCVYGGIILTEKTARGLRAHRHRDAQTALICG